MLDRILCIRRSRIILVLCFAFLLFTGLPSQAGGQAQQLKMPFRAGAAQINFDETYFGDTPHPTNGAIAFDMTVVPNEPNPEILAIGSGEVRLACTHRSGASILVFRADGYSGDFVYVHLEASSLPSWMSTSWTRVVQGEVIGRMFPDRIDGVQGDACLQFSTGPHLHLDLPQLNIVIDGVNFNEDFPNDFEQLTSTNGLPAGPETASCGGFEATIIGTIGDDLLVGTPGIDVIAGLRGNDEIRGMGGDDILCGGKGNDTISGGEGFDVIYGNNGHDTVYGNDASSRIDVAGGRYFGGEGNDIISGTSRQDRMKGGSGRDQLYGYGAQDWIRGGRGGDRIEGGGAIDDVHGGKGDDLIITGAGDIVRAGGGDNVCDVSGGVPATLISCD